MSVASGTRLGAYEIIAPLGVGGMGEVYRARDTKLNRDVAIKVLPAAFAEDRERVARFRREAQVVASLNHPNIAAIYGLEETNGTVALALELVDGEDLAERLARGPLPVDEAISVAKQIAEGLEAAHERGIVHRDLKPANVKLTREGTVKVLDFGLAKAYEGDPTASDSGLTQSPTMSRNMTEAGMILGTAAYMSPEQARGKPVDKRSDIWSFGVVLFELLSGRRLFAGETVTDVLAAVLTREPDWEALPAGTPPSVQRLLSRCLERQPRRRLRDIGEARIALEEPRLVESAVPGVQQGPRPRLLRAMPWAVAAAALLLAGAALVRRGGPNGAAGQVLSLDVTYPPDVEPIGGMTSGLAISPDGRTVVTLGVRSGVRKLFVRRLDGMEAIEVPGSAGANGAAFSPDGSTVALVPAAGTITCISLADWERRVVTTGADAAGSVAWGPPGIVFNRSGSLWIVSAEGGAPRALTALDAARHEVLHVDPLILPGSRTVLFSSLTSEPGTERIEAVSIEGGKRAVVVERAITPLWSPTGHLLFGREGAVMAAPFDAGTVTLRGPALPVLPSGVVRTVAAGTLGMRISSTGTLAFVPSTFGARHVVSVGRDGAALPLALPVGRYASPRIAPDGRRLLVESSGSTLEVLDMARGTRGRLTAAAIGTLFPVWSADGERVVFRRFNSPTWTASDGSGKAGLVPLTVSNDFPSGPGPDPDSALFLRIQPETSGDIFLVSLSGKYAPRALVATRAYEGGAQLSPDGRLLLYASDESGQLEIYVRRYPDLDRPWQVSEGGGAQGRWSRSSREIFYRSGQRMMAVTLDASGTSPVFGKPVALFDDEYAFGQGLTIANYDVTPDGRFLMLRPSAHGDSVRVVVNWTEDLRRVLAKGGVR